MVLSILIVDRNPSRSAILEQTLADAGHRVIARLDSERKLTDWVAHHQPDVIVIDLEAPRWEVLEQIRELCRVNPKPIVLFTAEKDPQYIRQAIQAGVSAYVVDGLQKERVVPIVEVAIARFQEYQALRRELETARLKLSERKLIERAKGLLMQQRGYSEDEAYTALRRLAMRQNRRLVDIARGVIDAAALMS